ncbi:MAG: hypothetical protein PHP42_09475 [Bacteroidota bacterium]|nr:hypothetical protein [Bacteroidota bacterium]
MWKFEHSIITDVSAEKIWKIWSNVEAWNKWDKEVEWAKIQGDFAVGTIGYLKPKGAPKSKFVMTGCKKNESFSDRSFLPLATLEFFHVMKQTNDGLVVTHSIKISGLLSWVFAKLIGEKLSKGLPEAMNELVTLAKQKN